MNFFSVFTTIHCVEPAFPAEMMFLISTLLIRVLRAMPDSTIYTKI